MEKNNQILDEIKKAIHSVDEHADVILFGSRARGDYHEESDWDILVLTDKENYRRVRDDMRIPLSNVEIKYNAFIELKVKNRDTWDDLSNTDFYLNVTEDGVLI